MNDNYTVGIDLGGSSVKAVAVTLEGKILRTELQEFDSDKPLDWAETIRTILNEFSLRQGSPPARVGLSAPGLAAQDALSIAYMPGRLQGLEGLNWTRFLETAEPVLVLNDAHAALLGEVWAGAARGLRNVILLTLGTGVGGAAMVDGQLLKGQIGRAGHLGHDCLDMNAPADVTGIPGSIEFFIGNYSIGERTGNRFENTHDLIRASENGDGFAREVWHRSVRALACSIAGHINAFDPAAVILGGGIARAGKALFDPLEKFLRPIEWAPGNHRVRLLAAELGEFAGAIGAARNSLGTR